SIRACPSGLPDFYDTLRQGSSQIRKKSDTSYYLKSHNFYDSVYKKFSRTKITHLLYNLAFIEPGHNSLPDSVQVLKSTEPFEQYSGKVIRSIHIKVLQPFGPSIYDTAAIAFTGVGKALNSVHVNTRKYVIRQYLLFRKGQRVDPDVLADNERILRELSFLDNARILVSSADSCADSVDLTVITKDVWSIGFDIPVITPSRVVGRLFDANFLGTGDRFTVTMSGEIYRPPFFRFDGLSYSFTNIAGSHINATIEYYANNEGDRSYALGFERPFLTNRTKWAGGTGIIWWKDVINLEAASVITTEYNNEGLWVGRAFLVKGHKKESRIVIASALYRTKFSQRPSVTIDSNRNFYNHFQTLASLSYSINNFYVTDYVLGFGKIENLPYGHLFQMTIGWDQTDFYSRVYSGLTLSAGRFFDRFGYLSGFLSFSGFFHGNSFEDAVFKVYGKYFTPLLRTKNNRYKFRSYFISDYRLGFNQRSNNIDYYDINLDFNINKVKNPLVFEGVHALSASLTGVCFTPWFFYGFRFGLTVNLQAGVVAPKSKDLLRSPLFTGIGLGVLIKNDNLIFPTFMISGYYYPNTGGNLSSLQTYLSSDLHMNFADYNVTAPHEESIGN
ncbi:MAG: hypothetical protein WCI71_15760, partial [Bacteroidota bacterium]